MPLCHYGCRVAGKEGDGFLPFPAEVFAAERLFRLSHHDAKARNALKKSSPMFSQERHSKFFRQWPWPGCLDVCLELHPQFIGAVALDSILKVRHLVTKSSRLSRLSKKSVPSSDQCDQTLLLPGHRPGPERRPQSRQSKRPSQSDVPKLCSQMFT